MEPVVLNKKSWHYRLACRSHYGNLGDMELERGEVDLCRYIRNVIWGALKVAFFTIVVGSFLSSVSMSIVHQLMIEFIGPVGLVPFVLLSAFGTVLVVVSTFAAIGIMLGLFVGILTLIERHNAIRKSPSDGFLGKAYRSWKDKYCQKVELK